MQVPTPAEVTARVAEIFSNASLLGFNGKPDTVALNLELAQRLLSNGVLPGDEVDEGAVPIGTLLDEVFDDLVRPGDKGYTDLEASAFEKVSSRVDRALKIEKDGSGPVQSLIHAENRRNGNAEQGITLLRRKVKTPGKTAAWAYYVSDDPDCIEEDSLDVVLDRQRIAQNNAAQATNFYGQVQPANAKRFASKTRQALEEGSKQAQGMLNA